MRVLAVDPGERRLGIAISDPGGVIANPLTVINHVSRQIDAGLIANLALENQVGLIVVGQTLDENGYPDYSGRRASRLAEAIRLQTDIQVEFWDEGGSTKAARRARIEMGVGRKKRAGHLDDLAATFILQTYLDARSRG